jgi:elongation factor 1-alpha
MRYLPDHIEVINTEMMMPDQPPENDNGNREYKWRITPRSQEEHRWRCLKLATQLNFRMYEGGGKALYMLGIHDCGKAVGTDETSLHKTINIIMEAAAEIKQTRIDRIRLYKGRCGSIATLRFSNPRLVNVF